MFRTNQGMLSKAGLISFATIVGYFAGCTGSGPNLVSVQGTVTLDGKPLEAATVQLTPELQADGMVRPTMAMTDKNGKYSVQYSTERSGTRPGSYKVSISTFRPAALDNEERTIPRLPEVVPQIYNMKSTLTIDVGESGNTYDFDLKTSAGPVVQPDGMK